MKKNKIIVGMSGGVDSSVTALMLLEQGFDVEGLFMKNWEEDDTDEYCSATDDIADAQQVCDRLGIELHTINFSAEYWDEVFGNFVSEYEAGRTPNPDILCNREIKFKRFLEYATEVLGGVKMATGHYARIVEKEGEFALLRGVDRNKDQSYFLYTLGQKQLSQSLFPIGEQQKPAVRKMADLAGFCTSTKKDSTGICFIGERKFNEFLGRYVSGSSGAMVTPEGDVVGHHRGLMFYTLGQRKGLGIGGLKGYSETPWYVVDKYLDSNQLVVAQGHDHPRLFKPGLIAIDVSWAREQKTIGFDCTAKVRYRSEDQPCRVEPMGNGQFQVVFDQPLWAITPGQSVVFYQGEECLGGGIIDCYLESS